MVISVHRLLNSLNPANRNNINEHVNISWPKVNTFTLLDTYLFKLILTQILIDFSFRKI